MSHDQHQQNRRLILSERLLSQYNKHDSMHNIANTEEHQQTALLSNHQDEQDDNAVYILGYN